MPRKYVHPDCDGGIFCPVPGHVVRRSQGSGRWRIAHVPLTAGQNRTLYERRNPPTHSTDSHHQEES
jgi:hypothetical protein